MKKLKRILEKSIDTEELALALMVELRKSLESSGTDKYDTLKFYANWVLHPEIDRIIEDAKTFFIELQDAVDLWFVLKKCRDTEIICRHHINDRIKVFLSFATFKYDLLSYLEDNQIETSLTQENEWTIFLNNLRKNLLDISLNLPTVAIKKRKRSIERFYVSNIIPSRLEKMVPGMQRLLDAEVFLAWHLWLSTSDFPMVGFIETTDDSLVKQQS